MNKAEDADEERALWHDVRSNVKRIDALVVSTSFLSSAVVHMGHASFLDYICSQIYQSAAIEPSEISSSD
jgi:hypothetical protein